ncbi:MAG: hypothetical protein ABIH85_00005, partial [Candidatus Omnitrophota bacterium]
WPKKYFVAQEFDFEGSELEPASIVMPTVERHEHDLIVMRGTVTVKVEGEIAIKAKAGDSFFVGANSPKYTIESSEKAEVLRVFPEDESYDYLNEMKEDEKKTETIGTAVLAQGEEIAKTAHTYQESVTLVETSTGPTSYITGEIVGKTMRMPEVLAGRAHTIQVKAGTVMVEIFDMMKRGQSQERIKLTKDEGLTIAKGDFYSIDRADDSKVNSVVRFDYVASPSEMMSDSTVSMVKKHLPEIINQQIELFLPQENFITGDVNTVGSALWEQAQLQRYISDKIKIRPYSARMGLKDVAKRSVADGAIGILVGTKSSLENADKNDKNVRDFLMGRRGKVRVLAIPDIDKVEELENKGWYFNREVEGTALLLAAVKPEQLAPEHKGEENAADDLIELMRRLTGKEVQRKYLYYMLAYSEMGPALNWLPAQLRTDIFGWLKFIVLNMLLEMPMRPLDPTAEFQRREKIWQSV